MCVVVIAGVSPIVSIARDTSAILRRSRRRGRGHARQIAKIQLFALREALVVSCAKVVEVQLSKTILLLLLTLLLLLLKMLLQLLLLFGRGIAIAQRELLKVVVER